MQVLLPLTSPLALFPLLSSPQVISQVRFSDLEVPTDAEVLLATLRLERKQRTAPQHVPSTYATDMAPIASELEAAWQAGRLVQCGLAFQDAMVAGECHACLLVNGRRWVASCVAGAQARFSSSSHLCSAGGSMGGLTPSSSYSDSCSMNMAFSPTGGESSPALLGLAWQASGSPAGQLLSLMFLLGES